MAEDKNILQAEQTVGDASTKLLGATTLLQEFSNSLGSISRNPIMSGTVFIGLSNQIRNHYIKAIREANDLTKEQISNMEKVVNTSTQYARVGIAIGGITQSVANLNNQLRETALQMGHFSNLSNLPGGATTALGSAKYMGVFRGNVIGNTNAATAEQTMQAYKQLFGQMTGNNIDTKNMESLATLAGMYQVGGGTDLASSILGFQGRHGGFGGVSNTNKQFTIQRSLANAVHKNTGLLSFSGNVGNMGQSLSNINDIASSLIGTPGVANEEQAYAKAMGMVGALGMKGAQFGATNAGSIIGGAISTSTSVAGKEQLLGAAHMAGVSTQGIDARKPEDIIKLMFDVSRKLPGMGDDPRSMALVNTFGKFMNIGTGQEAREKMLAMSKVSEEEYRKIQGDVNKSLRDWQESLSKDPTLFTEYEESLKGVIKGNRTLKDWFEQSKQKLQNRLPDSVRDIAPTALETVGTGIGMAVDAAQLFAMWRMLRGKGAPSGKFLGGLFGGGGRSSIASSTMSEEADLAFAINGFNSGGKISKTGGLFSKAKSFGKFLPYLSIPFVAAEAAETVNDIEASRMDEMMGNVAKVSPKDFLQISMLNTPEAVGQRRAALQGAGSIKESNKFMQSQINTASDKANQFVKDAGGKEAATQKILSGGVVGNGGNSSTIDLYIHTDDGNVRKQSVENNRAVIDFVFNSSTSVQTYNNTR